MRAEQRRNSERQDHELAALNRALDGKKKSEDADATKALKALKTTPTLANLGCEDAAQCMNTETYCNGVRAKGKEAMLSGTDYGLATLSTHVALSIRQYLNCVEYYNAMRNSNPADVSILVLPTPIKFTAQYINQKGLSRAFARKRERELKVLSRLSLRDSDA